MNLCGTHVGRRGINLFLYYNNAYENFITVTTSDDFARNAKNHGGRD